MLSVFLSRINTILNPLNEQIKKYKDYIWYLLLFLSFWTIFLLGDSQFVKFSGEQALNLLWIILLLPIFAKVLSLDVAKTLMWLRKELWILMGMLAFVHSLQYFLPSWSYVPNFSILSYSVFWIYDGMITSVAIGIAAFAICFILLITSNRFSINTLGKNWKRIHRIVYILIVLVILHKVLLWWEREWSVDYGELALVLGYFAAKILEWKNITLLKKKDEYPKWQKWICPPCGYIYDPKVGDTDSGIAPGTEFSDIPDSWRCPICWVAKADFIPYTPTDDSIISAKILKVTNLNPTTIELTINSPKKIESKPGQFMTFKFTDLEWDFYRSYSIAWGNGYSFIFLIKITELGRWGKVLRNIQAWTTVEIHWPHGTFLLQETPIQKIFIATGTGLAPVYAMIQSLPDSIKKTLHFSISKKDDIFYAEELRKIQNLNLHIHVTKEQVEGFEFWRMDIESILPEEKDTEWYLCGNQKMIEETTKKLQEHGFSHVYSEEFGS